MKHLIPVATGAAVALLPLAYPLAAQSARVDVSFRSSDAELRIPFESGRSSWQRKQLKDVHEHERELLKHLSEHERERLKDLREAEREYLKEIRESHREWLKDQREREREVLQREREVRRDLYQRVPRR